MFVTVCAFFSRDCTANNDRRTHARMSCHSLWVPVSKFYCNFFLIFKRNLYSYCTWTAKLRYRSNNVTSKITNVVSYDGHVGPSTAGFRVQKCIKFYMHFKLFAKMTWDIRRTSMRCCFLFCNLIGFLHFFLCRFSFLHEVCYVDLYSAIDVVFRVRAHNK